MVNGAKMKTWLWSKDHMLGKWSKVEAKSMTVKAFVKAPEISKVMLQNTILSDESHAKEIKSMPHSSSESQ